MPEYSPAVHISIRNERATSSLIIDFCLTIPSHMLYYPVNNRVFFTTLKQKWKEIKMHTSIQRLEPDKLTSQLPNSMLTENGATYRIAHIDDDPDIRDTVRRILNANGYIVDSYQTMSGFIKSLQDSRNHPDLAVLDVMVETMDSGLEAYVEIRKRFPEIPMIFMTSLGEEIRPYFTGVTDDWILIVEKPVEPVSFLSIIRSRLDNSKSKADSS